MHARLLSTDGVSDCPLLESLEQDSARTYTVEKWDGEDWVRLRYFGHDGEMLKEADAKHRAFRVWHIEGDETRVRVNVKSGNRRYSFVSFTYYR